MQAEIAAGTELEQRAWGEWDARRSRIMRDALRYEAKCRERDAWVKPVCVPLRH